MRPLASCVAMAIVACGGPEPAANPATVIDDARFDVVTLTDTNPDPRIVEVTVVATTAKVEYLPGKSADVWAYRDGAIPGSAATVPGPMLVANKGDEVVVHFRNELPESTTIHWHGIRLANAMDGASSTQQLVMPGAAFEYRFTVPDAGSYWFHPHVRADVQIEKGLYAPLVVRGDDTPVDATRERYFVLDDVKLTADGQLAQETDAMDLMMGRQGNVLLVNGKRGGQIAVEAGSRERWRLVNAANGRYFKLRLGGHRFRVIGADGGLVPSSFDVDELLVAPGERYDVLVEFAAAEGTRVALETVHYDRGHRMPDPGPKALLEVVYRGRSSRALAPVATTLRDVEPLAVPPGSAVRRFELRELEAADGPRFYINDQFWPFNTPVMVQRGATEIWEIVNTAEMDHPFHLHGMFFQPLAADGTIDRRLGWKDTLNVPQSSTTRIAVRYEALGMWMFHCHILEHAERGMMGDLMVMDGSGGGP